MVMTALAAAAVLALTSGMVLAFASSANGMILQRKTATARSRTSRCSR